LIRSSFLSFSSREAAKARTTPASVLRSVIPMAVWPSSIACSTSSAGCEPLRRKL
jgi:hypothetical protein